jgi:hypothetical protein
VSVSGRLPDIAALKNEGMYGLGLLMAMQRRPQWLRIKL